MAISFGWNFTGHLVKGVGEENALLLTFIA